MTPKIPTQLPSKPIQANVDLLIQREQVGLGKYGVTLGDAKLSHEQLLQHALEESLDLSNYIQTALQTVSHVQADYDDLKRRLEEQIIRRNMGYKSGLCSMEQLLDDHHVAVVRRQLKG